MARLSTQQAREAVLQTADRLFYTQGYHATGINQIIAEAEVAKQTFYNHFPGKERLGIAWLQRDQQRWMEELDATLDKRSGPAKRLLELFSFLENWMRVTNFRGCALLNTIAETPDRDAELRMAALQYKAGLRKRIHDEASGLRKGGAPLKSKKLAHLADGIYLLFEAAMVEAQTHGDTWPIDEAKWQARRLLKETD